MVERLSFKGSCEISSYSTKAALTVDSNLDDKARIQHEASAEFLGVDQYGNNVPSDPLLKTQMTEGVIVTNSITMNKDTGQRQKDRTVTPANFPHLIAHNLTFQGGETGPIPSRCIVPELAKPQNRKDRTALCNVSRKYSSAEQATMENLIRCVNIIHIYAMTWFKVFQIFSFHLSL